MVVDRHNLEPLGLSLSLGFRYAGQDARHQNIALSITESADLMLTCSDAGRAVAGTSTASGRCG